MPARAVVVLAMCLAALQLSSASEDLDWGEPQTALWAIGREHAIVTENKVEAAQIVQAAAENATAVCKQAAEAQIKAWQDPIDAAAAKATAAGVNVTSCLNLWSQDIQNRNARVAVPWCVVAARAQYDARVNKLQATADGMLDLIVKAQEDIRTCANRPGELLQALCRQSKVTWDVLTAQDNKSKQAVPAYFQVYDHARSVIPEDALACTLAALQRNEFSAQNVIEKGVRCIEDNMSRRTTPAPSA